MSGVNWRISSQQSAEESDILEPEDLQEVLMETNGAIMDCVFNNSDEFYGQGYDDDGVDDTKLFYGAMPRADTTFIPNVYAAATGALPAREDYSGPYGFSVLLDGTPSAKNKWAYSKSLNKLYIVFNKIIPIQFKWTPNDRNFVVRALPVYTDAQDMKTAVLRCMLHTSLDDETNDGFEYVNHVVRSDNPGTLYEENPESKRCSVVVPLGEPQPGTGAVTVTYKFMCKTTCVTGMMRRPITVLFTLERPGGEVVGRQKLNVKICSCPSRDMKKDEEAQVDKQQPGGVKRPMSLMEKNVAHRLARRPKLEHSEQRILVVQFEDKDIFQHILEFNHGAATSVLRRTPPDNPNYQALKDFLNTIEDKINAMQSSNEVSATPGNEWTLGSLFPKKSPGFNHQ